MRYVLALAALVSVQSLACDKVDYAEAKDWPVETLEAAFCADFHESVQTTTQAADLHDPGLLRYSNRCAEQAMMYHRILKNLHGRAGAPDCSKYRKKPQ